MLMVRFREVRRIGWTNLNHWRTAIGERLWRDEERVRNYRFLELLLLKCAIV